MQARTSHTVSLNAGEDIKLQCDADGYPSPNITWVTYLVQERFFSRKITLSPLFHMICDSSLQMKSLASVDAQK